MPAAEKMRIDWVELPQTDGALGLTSLPGRVDHQRDMDADLNVFVGHGVTHVLTLLGDDELHQYGVGQLPKQIEQTGFTFRQLPIADRQVCEYGQAEETVEWLLSALAARARIVVHCVGGLGRSGMMAACVLKRMGLGASEAIALVRKSRSPRAIETIEQERFVESF